MTRSVVDEFTKECLAISVALTAVGFSDGPVAHVENLSERTRSE